MSKTTIANRYEVIDKLGQGGMGAVYHVYDRLEKTEVALKQVLISEKQLLFASKADTDDTDKLRLSLAHEFSILATLRHPHILSVLDFGFDDKGHPFYTMTLLKGSMDFKSYAEDISHHEKIRVLTQMLQALHYLHRRGILHRDLKPDNVLIGQDGQVKVMDFGLAKKENQDAHPSTQDDGSIVGTVMYMAPELFQGEQASVESDLFAFGIMAYEVLTGTYPHEFVSVSTLVMKLITERPDTTMLSSELAEWLANLLDKDPKARPKSAYETLQGLYDAEKIEMSAETQLIRESFLQASDFIGRDSELKQLTDALNKLDNTSTFFLIGGESGVGKSRLTDELRIEALVRNALVMRGQGVDGSGLPFQLWREIIQRMLLTVEVTDTQASILKDIVPDMDALIGRKIDSAPELTGKAYTDRMILNIVDLFRNLSQPIVLLLEDLQWANESIAVLEQMLKVQEQLPQLMIVATYRDDEAPDLPNTLDNMTHIKLERLNADAVSELSRAMLGDVGANTEIVKLLHSQSEGNLFFLVETVRALAEASGALQRIGEGELPEGVFTGGMQAITRRHLSKVDLQYTEIQTLAAIIGREIDTKILANAHDETSINAWLRNASEYNVVTIQDNTWRFTHDKLRETIIIGIDPIQKPTLHRTVAEAIETTYPNNNSYSEKLLDHWQTAGDWDKELHYLTAVTERMVTFSADYTNALKLIESRIDRVSQSDEKIIDLLVFQASALTQLGQIDQAQTTAQKALHLAEEQGQPYNIAHSLYIVGRIASDRSDYAEAQRLLNRSLAIFEDLENKKRVGQTLGLLGLVALEQSNYDEATTLFEKSLSNHEQINDTHGIGRTFNMLGLVAVDKGDLDQGKSYYERSLQLYQKVGDQDGATGVLNNLAGIAFYQGDYAGSRDMFESAVNIFQATGSKASLATSLGNIGVVLKNMDELQEADSYFKQSLQIGEDIDNQYIAVIALTNLSFLAHQLQPEKMSDYWIRAMKIAQSLDTTAVILELLVSYGWLYLKENKPLKAAQLIGLVKSHPSNNTDVEWRINELMPSLKEGTSPDDLATALEQGKERDLDTVVQELLDEFPSATSDVSEDNE